MPTHKNTNKNKSKRRGRKNNSRPLPGVVRDSSHPMYHYHVDKGVIEVKYIDTTQSNDTLSSTGTVTPLNACVQGTDSINRLGRKIVCNSVSVRGVVANSATDLNNGTSFPYIGDVVKVAIVLDKQVNGAAPVFGDVFNINAGSMSPFANQNISNVDRFHILWEKNLTICATNNTLAHFEITMNCDLETRYNTNNNGNATDMVSGGIFLAFADTNSSGSLSSIMAFSARVTFKDA